MISLRVLVSTATVCTIMAAGPLAGQSLGTLEFGLSGGYVDFDQNLDLDDTFASGAHLGLYLLPRLFIEGEVQYAAMETASGVDVTYIPIRARLLYGQPLLARLELLLGGGFVQNHYDNYNNLDILAQDYGVTGSVGLRMTLGSSLAVRVAGTVDYISEPINLERDTWTYGVGAGVDFRFNPFSRGGPSAPIDVDRDRDGIANDRDACPDTPRGVAVDGRGCPVPVDGDGDGVTDANDACPDTPAGAAVDARGCPIPVDADGDGDGVPDSRDACAATPAGAEVDERGCPLPRDADGDGVADAEDACPRTALGTAVDARGCPAAADADRDGVADSQDACPDTPAGAEVDARGCPVPADADGDGVPDSRDACAGTPVGAEVNERGCPVPADADGDGVADADDACPDTPAGQRVDLRGCAPRGEGDGDGDGVVDAEDRCPGTPSGEAVDERGCRSLFAAGETTVILQDVGFEAGDEYVLTPAARGVLDEVAEWLKAHPELRIEIAAHTDNTEFRPYAMSRSLGRASAVRRYLIGRGVTGERLLARGYGPDQPVASNDTAAGRARNERIELRRLN